MRVSEGTALTLYTAARQAANICQATAVAWLVAASTGSAGAVALVWSLNLLPWLGLPLFGSLADRLPRRAMVRIADGAVAVLAVGMVAATAHGRLPLGLALGWTGAYALLTASARPAVKGLAREIGEPAGAARLVATFTATEYAVLGGGQLLAALLLIGGQAPAAFGAVAALLLAGLGALRGTGAPRPTDEATPSWTATLHLLAGPDFRGPFLLTILCGAAAFTARTLAPLLAIRNLHAGVLGYAALGAAYSFGAAVGAAWERRRDDWRDGIRSPAAGWLAAAAAVALAGRTDAVTLGVAAFAVIGIASGYQDAGNAARVAGAVPPGAQSRAMALTSLVWRVPGMLAGGIAGLGDRIALPQLLAGLAIAEAVIASAAWARAVTAHSPARSLGD